jgi:hypothetical protein
MTMRMNPVSVRVLIHTRPINALRLSKSRRESLDTRRVAGLELRGEWMCEKVLFGTPLIRFQGIVGY